MRTTIFAISILIASLQITIAQTTPGESILVGTWKVEKMEEAGKPVDVKLTPPDYRMIFSDSHILQQGIPPDGLLDSHWSFDETKMTLVLTDDQSKMIYTIKVLRLSKDELIFQTNESSRELTMYYLPVVSK